MWFTKKNDKDVELSNQPSRDIFELFRSLPFGESFKFLAASSSMEPAIMKGETLEIERINPSQVKIGDVVAFWSEDLGTIIAHRVKKIDARTIITKGDNNLLEDKKNKKRNVIGRVKN